MPSKPRTFTQLLRQRQPRKRPKDTRATPADRGYDNRWRRFAKKWYLPQHPLCVACGQPAQCVDHILPLSEGGEKYDEANLQALCQSCHNRKTKRERAAGGSGGQRKKGGRETTEDTTFCAPWQVSALGGRKPAHT